MSKSRMRPRELSTFEIGRPHHITPALDWLQAWIERGRAEANGVRCPCCNQVAKVYRRRFNRSMARFLIGLVAAHQKEAQPYHVDDIGTFKGGEYAYSRHWGMIRSVETDDGGDTKSSGLWEPTTVGVLVAQNRLPFFSHALIYNNECLGVDGDKITLADVLRDPDARRHSYSELVQEAGLDLAPQRTKREGGGEDAQPRLL